MLMESHPDLDINTAVPAVNDPTMKSILRATTHSQNAHRPFSPTNNAGDRRH